MKKLLCILCAIACVLTLAGCGSEAVDFKPTERFFVNDYANVIEDSAENAIYEKGAALDNATTAQVVVVTVKNISGKPISDFAVELGRDWGVGTEEDDNGVLILLCTDIREIFVATGYGLEGALPDSKTGRLIDTYALSHFEANDFSSGLLSLYSAIVNEVYIEYGLSPTEGYTPIDKIPEATVENGEAMKILASWLLLIVLVALYLGIFRRRHRFIYFGGPPFGGYGGFGGFGGMGGFGSGGSFGSGGFRGGGGSFGGGGAGRKF